jgi:hypothetical protein
LLDIVEHGSDADHFAAGPNGLVRLPPVVPDKGWSLHKILAAALAIGVAGSWKQLCERVFGGHWRRFLGYWAVFSKPVGVYRAGPYFTRVDPHFIVLVVKQTSIIPSG